MKEWAEKIGGRAGALRLPGIAGKVAFVTGSSQGIGFAVAQGLSANGATVVLNGRDRARLEAAEESIRGSGGDVSSIQADFSAPDEIRAACRVVEARYGRVDILVANVGGLGEPRPTVEETEEHWRFVIDANLTGAFLTIRSLLPGMIDRGAGSIVTISSTAGRHPSLACAAYSVAKAGVVMLTRHLANELGPRGIRVNCVAPGAILTENSPLRSGSEEQRERVAAMHPLGRLGTPQDVASAVLYLASDSASWITGVTLDVCGGRVSV